MVARIGLLALAALAAAASATPLDDYVSKPDEHYGWFDTNDTITGMAFGGTGYVLNVTSQKWLDETQAYIRGRNSVWTHQVVVIIPKGTLEIRNTSMAYLTGNCNDGDPGVPKANDEDIAVADALAHNTKMPVIVVFQIPNCHMMYPADVLQKPRSEDAMIAFAWYQVMNKTAPGYVFQRVSPFYYKPFLLLVQTNFLLQTNCRLTHSSSSPHLLLTSTTTTAATLTSSGCHAFP